MGATTGSYIESRPDKCGGRPCIAGTRIRVQDIYVWHELEGRSPEEIVASFPQLSLAAVHSALAFYFDHQAEIQAELRSEREHYEIQKRQHPSKFLQKLTGQDGDEPPVSS